MKMPFQQTQLRRILDPDLIPQKRMPHTAMRIAESYLKRRAFVWEDSGVLALQKLYHDAYASLRIFAAVASDNANLTTLGQDTASQRFRDQFVGYATERLHRLTNDAAAEGLRRATMAWYAGYYGRLWLLDVSTRADVRIPVSPPNIDTMARQTLQRLKEDVYDDLIRDLMGREWRAQYADEIDDLILRIKRGISSGMTSGEGIPDIMRRVRTEMGVSTDRRSGYRANFNRVQAIVRTTVNTASNNGTMEAYRRNADILSGAHWLAARDERTCPRCGGLDGTFIRLGDSLRPPAHINCRCTLIPAIREDLLVPYDEPPRQTLSEWADAFGLSMLLTDFLSARRLQSDRIG